MILPATSDLHDTARGRPEWAQGPFNQAFLTTGGRSRKIRRFPNAQAGLSMYAVVKSGGKQYRVSAGEKLKIEQIPADIGAEIDLDQVMLVADGEDVRMGTPLVPGASVKAKVLAHGRGAKIRIFKLNRRKHYRRTQGHRQNYTEVEILGITG
jgi:large subunit ribosomal protein L21